MKTDPKKLLLNQENLKNLTEKAKVAPQLGFTGRPVCLETNCICCHGKF